MAFETLKLGLLLLAGATPAPAQTDLAEARRQCWEAVGVYGNPYRTRGASRFEEEVKACIRRRMAGGAAQTGQPRR